MYQWLCTCLARTPFASEVFMSLLWIGTVHGSTDIHVSSWSKNSSDISIYCYPIITLQQLAVTLQYWTPFSAQTSCITSTSWDLFWVTAGVIIDGKLQSLRFQGPLIPARVVVEDGRLPSDHYMTSLMANSKTKSCFHRSYMLSYRRKRNFTSLVAILNMVPHR